MLDTETEEELADEIPILCNVRKNDRKPTVVVAERVFLVSELKEAPVGEDAEVK